MFGDGQEARSSDVTFGLLEFIGHVVDLPRNVIRVGQQCGRAGMSRDRLDERRANDLPQCAHPIAIPEMLEKSFVERRFEERNLQWIVLFAVDTEVFDFVQGNRLVFDRFALRLVTLGVRTEGADIDLAGRYRTRGIDLVRRADART